MSSPNFSVFGTLFSQTANKLKWKNATYCLNQKASCFDISPDGSSFLIGETNGQLVALRISDGELVVSDSCERHHSRITDIAFNPTADLIATCSNENKIELSSFRADLSKSGNRRISMSMNESVRALTFMEDLASRSNILFSGVGRQICITDCSSGTTFRILKGHKGIVTAFCTWGGCLLASSSTDKTIRIWDTRVTEAVRVFDPLTKPGVTGAFHVDGSGRILVRGDGSGEVHVYDTSSSTKKIITKRISTRSISCLRIANSQRFMAVADEKRISLCDLRDVFQMPKSSYVAKCIRKCVVLKWHPIKPSFATLDNESALNLWQTERKHYCQLPCSELLFVGNYFFKLFINIYLTRRRWERNFLAENLNPGCTTSALTSLFLHLKSRYLYSHIAYRFNKVVQRIRKYLSQTYEA
ncbi:WD repeat-containing protein [Dirofilaria immitis]